MIDTHTHCYHSHDSQEDPRKMIEQAIANGMEYLAITDHCDKDIVSIDRYKNVAQIDLDSHFNELNKLKEEYSDRIQLGVGLEFGYSKYANQTYLDINQKYKSDIIINSVHIMGESDCYDKECFFNKSKQESYLEYLELIKESINVPYDYDTIAHIGYVCRKAPYEDKFLAYDDFMDIFDEILKAIIQKGKALEINSHSEGTGSDYLPTNGIISRYKQLGGELLTFASDAHTKERICRNYNLVIDNLKFQGFKYIFKYLNHEAIPYKI